LIAANPHPFVLSLSKDAPERQTWFDRLTTNGKEEMDA
jgi:hypothetical protein